MEELTCTKRGRPTVYDPDTCPARAEKWAEHGCGLGEIARRLGVSRATVSRWKREHPEFGVAIDAGWETAAETIERRFHELAYGYHYDVTTVTHTPAGKTTTRRTLYAKPSPQAMLLYLFQRCPQRWTKDPKPPPPPRLELTREDIDQMAAFLELYATRGLPEQATPSE